MMLTSFSWVCWAWPNSVTAHQLGSGLSGLGIGALSFDWSGISAYLYSPLMSPFFASLNIFVGFVIVIYIVTPATYWGNIYNAKTFPIFSSQLFQTNGQEYDITSVVDSKFELNLTAYEEVGPIHLSTFFAITYGFGFASIAATLSHVALFYGKEIWLRTRTALKSNEVDVHTRLMRRYTDIPNWWFLILMVLGIAVSIATVEGYKSQLQLPWWGILLACALASFFTLPVGVIAATTNQVPGLNIITEYMMGYILPGQPIANVCFKTYGYISMTQAVSFLQDFKLGHYMKIPPRSMFIVQIVGTIVAAVVNMGVAWWLLTTIPNICNINVLPSSSPWTCPSDRVFFDASVIWGLVGPKRIFGSLGEYSAINWFFLGGFLAPVPMYLLHRCYPKVKLFTLVNMPILLGATGMMPPATAVNYTSWFLMAFIFNYVIFKYHKNWWTRYNYVLSGALDAGLAFMGVLIYLSLGLENISITWWGTNIDGCTYANCPTQPGINITGCPVF
jgi:OPT family oligopeptide transporter